MTVKTYDKIVAGFTKTLSELEKLIVHCQNKEIEVSAKIDNLVVERDSLNEEARQAGTLRVNLKALLGLE